jgi:hypothetical protein
VAQTAHDGEIVRDEDQRQSELATKLHEQAHDLRLDRDVERAHGLVANDELGLEHERAGDGDALALAARELVRVTIELAAGEPHAAQNLRYGLTHARLVELGTVRP